MSVFGAVKTFFERGEASESELIEETFGLIKRLDETEDETEAALLEAQVAEQSDELPDLSGWSVATVAGEVLAVCLDESQAKAIQQLLLLAPGGFVAVVVPTLTSIDNFSHPETSPSTIVSVLTADEEAL